MTVLITRSHDENVRLASILATHNIATISSPQIEYKELAIDLTKYKHYKEIVITSKFTAQILAKKVSWPVKALVVGKESAKILQSNLNIIVEEIFQNVEELNLFILQAKHTDILYIAGNNITKKLPIDKIEIYDTKYTNYISPDIVEKIKYGDITAIMIYSKKTAISFKTALESNNLTSHMQKIYIIALSQKIAFEFKEFGCNILYCNKPIEHDMINLVKKVEYGSKKEKV